MMDFRYGLTKYKEKQLQHILLYDSSLVYLITLQNYPCENLKSVFQSVHVASMVTSFSFTVPCRIVFAGPEDF